MGKDELVKFLKENGENEKSLSEADIPYIMHAVSEEPGVSGYAIVKLDEGAYLIPYGEVIPENGYEQLLSDEIRVADKETLEYCLGEMESAVDSYEKIFFNRNTVLKFNPKFNMRQKVYCIKKFHEDLPCEVCEGKKTFIVNNSKGPQRINCPNCNGTGKHRGDYSLILWKLLEDEVHPWKIGGFHITQWDGSEAKIQYSLEYENPNGCCTCISAEEENCFATLEEALSEIKKRNMNPMKEYED